MVRRTAKVSTVSGASLPDFSRLKKDHKKFKEEFDKAMYYAHYELSAKKLQTETVKYFKAQKLDHKLVDAVDISYYAILGKICFILNRGGEVPDDYVQYVEKQVATIKEDGKAKLAEKAIVTETKEAAPVINIQDRLREQAGKVAELFDLHVDTFMEAPSKFKADGCDPYAAMTKADLKAGHARWVVKFYESDLEELKCALSGDDEQLKEGYGIYTKTQLKRLLKFYESIMQGATMIIETSKTTRKPRKKKAVSADKLVEKLKFQHTDKALGLVSINPRDIIGAQELWVYNTKTRKIGKYIASDASGLSVKSATILNFSPESTEKTLRKPAEQLKTFKGSGKVALRKFMDNIATIDTKLKSRLNEHHILLKVVK